MAKGITRAGIVAAAIDLLDEAGIDGVTVRALATRLGVRAPALYWHVRSKQDLLDEMGTEIQRRVFLRTLQVATADWRGGLAGYARNLRQEYLAHRDGARTFSGTRITDPEVLKFQEPWFEAMVATGLELAAVAAAGELVTAFVVGFVIEEQERAQSGPERYSPAAREDVLGESAPLVAEAGAAIFAAPDDRFERYLDVVLAGIQARLIDSPAEPGRPD